MKKLFLNKEKKTYVIDRDWICKHIDSGRVLDVGCACGQFLSIFDPKKWDRHGLDIEKESAEFAKRKYGIPVEVGSLFEIKFKGKFDLIILRGVIEHISEPITFIRKCKELLKPDGLLYITATPAGDSFAFNVYRNKWHLFTPPEHIHFFTVKLLNNKLEKMGLRLLDHHYQYQETPYADYEKDFEKIQKDIIYLYTGEKSKVKNSVPFPGSMITAVWKNQKNKK